jgi:hypothetical protein
MNSENEKKTPKPISAKKFGLDIIPIIFNKMEELQENVIKLHNVIEAAVGLKKERTYNSYNPFNQFNLNYYDSGLYFDNLLIQFDVDFTKEIPIDYAGYMGVPITFMDKYNPDQFEIIALGIVGSIDFTCNKKMEIINKQGELTGKYTFNAKGTLYKKYNPKIDKTPSFKDCETGELYKSIYARIIIKNKRI